MWEIVTSAVYHPYMHMHMHMHMCMHMCMCMHMYVHVHVCYLSAVIAGGRDRARGVVEAVPAAARGGGGS